MAGASPSFSFDDFPSERHLHKRLKFAPAWGGLFPFAHHEIWRHGAVVASAGRLNKGKHMNRGDLYSHQIAALQKPGKNGILPMKPWVPEAADIGIFARSRSFGLAVGTSDDCWFAPEGLNSLCQGEFLWSLPEGRMWSRWSQFGRGSTHSCARAAVLAARPHPMAT